MMKTKAGQTALNLACHRKQLDLVKYLVEAGADMNMKLTDMVRDK
jgi:hypothetical protein